MRSKENSSVNSGVKVEVVHNDMVSWEKVNILKYFSPHVISLAEVIKHRVVQLAALMLLVVVQSIFDCPRVLNANIAESFPVKDFLAFEEIILFLVLESVQQDVLKIWATHLQDHLLKPSED